MEEKSLPPLSNVPQPTKARLLLPTVLVLILCAAVGSGVYFWQHGEIKDRNAKIASLQTQLGSSPGTQTGSFTYSPRTGGLSLTLPKTYGVIVNVDGNKGGAAGARFRVASVADTNILSDAAYQGIQIDIDNVSSSNNLNQAVGAEESELNSQSSATRTYQVTDTKLAGLPAKLITTTGSDEYQGNLSIYLVGAGSFLYTVTANGTQNASFPMLTAVLNGLAIKPVTL